MNLINELTKYGITERGNTSLYEADCEGGCAFFAEIEEGKWLEIVMNTDNYPAWNIAIQNKTAAEIKTHIEENFGNFYFQKNNIGANAVDTPPVAVDYVMAAVLDKLYNDNKDYATNDTVTVIHDFLESKEWSLDITDIENLRQEFDN